MLSPMNLLIRKIQTLSDGRLLALLVLGDLVSGVLTALPSAECTTSLGHVDHFVSDRAETIRSYSLQNVQRNKS
jgi:hypothetical protein